MCIRDRCGGNMQYDLSWPKIQASLASLGHTAYFLRTLTSRAHALVLGTHATAPDQDTSTRRFRSARLTVVPTPPPRPLFLATTAAPTWLYGDNDRSRPTHHPPPSTLFHIVTGSGDFGRSRPNHTQPTERRQRSDFGSHRPRLKVCSS